MTSATVMSVGSGTSCFGSGPDVFSSFVTFSTGSGVDALMTSATGASAPSCCLGLSGSALTFSSSVALSTDDAGDGLMGLVILSFATPVSWYTSSASTSS